LAAVLWRGAILKKPDWLVKKLKVKINKMATVMKDEFMEKLLIQEKWPYSADEYYHWDLATHLL
jgi:hypothetical protein